MNSTASSTAAGTGSLRLEYISSREVGCHPAAWWQGVLGVVGFEKPPAVERARIPVTASMIRPLHAGDLCEVWRIADPEVQLASGSRQAGLHYRFSDDLLFGCLTLAESAIDARSESGALLRATEIAY